MSQKTFRIVAKKNDCCSGELVEIWGVGLGERDAIERLADCLDTESCLSYQCDLSIAELRADDPDVDLTWYSGPGWYRECVLVAAEPLRVEYGYAYGDYDYIEIVGEV